MRMRKKKYLNERLEAVSNRLFMINIDDRNFNTAIKTQEFLPLDDWFKNDNPIYLEIGCGKGKFACEFAKLNPDINVLAVEKSANVIVGACEMAEKENIENLRFIGGSAEYLPRFIPPHTVERIFLNFSCPFPKNAYATHRLTHHHFLKIYETLLTKTGEIHQKTDNMHFFEFSLEEFSQNGWSLKNISLDLHQSNFEDNIVTEYEAKFSSLGFPIYRLEAFLGEKND